MSIMELLLAGGGALVGILVTFFRYSAWTPSVASINGLTKLHAPAFAGSSCAQTSVLRLGKRAA